MRAVLSSDEAATARHYGMMQYHMGWVDADFAPSVTAGRQAAAPDPLPVWPVPK